MADTQKTNWAELIAQIIALATQLLPVGLALAQELRAQGLLTDDEAVNIQNLAAAAHQKNQEVLGM